MRGHRCCGDSRKTLAVNLESPLVSLREKALDDSIPPELERRHGAENRKMSVNLSRDTKLFAKEIFEILV
jgi:hypothetical protein